MLSRRPAIVVNYSRFSLLIGIVLCFAVTLALILFLLPPMPSL